MKEHEANLKKIYNYFGHENQIYKLNEEICELKEELGIEELQQDGKIEEYTIELLDEISDVLIVAYQLYMNNVKIRERVKFKIDRTLKRIESGYYENKTL